MSEHRTPRFEVEQLDQSHGHCDCCGHESRAGWGLVHSPEGTCAAYWMRWTVNHLSDTGANLDMVIGKWGDGTRAQDRAAVSLIHRQQPDSAPALMVVDAEARAPLAGAALRRDEVIGTPLAEQVFAIVDAIYEQDDRFF